MLKKIRRIFRVFLFLFIGGCLVLFVWGEIDRTIAEKMGYLAKILVNTLCVKVILFCIQMGNS